MPVSIRTATISDLPRMVDLLLADARRRHGRNPKLWPIASNARERVETAIRSALKPESQPCRQQWIVAEAGEKLVGLTHSMMLPVPPIYAGEWGDPGLLLEDCVLEEDAPSGMAGAILDAAESDLRDAGARILLGSSVAGGEWHAHFHDQGYEPLTLYYAKAGFDAASLPDGVRFASEDDIPAIVGRSAENRKILARLDAFWTPHRQADARFGNWMKHSLGLTDRDMLVTGSSGSLNGYAIAQPASPLHFPPAHDTRATGLIDDCYHSEFSDPSKTRHGGQSATALLRAAEAAFAGRGINTALVICPAAWNSKRSVLENAGYGIALVWMIKR